MRKLIVLFLLFVLVFVGCALSVLDYKWSNLRIDSIRYRTGKYIAYVWNRYIDKDFLFSNPFSQTIVKIPGLERIQYDLTAKILAVEPLDSRTVSLKLLMWKRHEYYLKVGPQIMFGIDPYYKDFVSFKKVPKEMYKKLRPGMYIRIYTWRKVGDDSKLGMIFTDWLQSSPVYKIMILKN